LARAPPSPSWPVAWHSRTSRLVRQRLRRLLRISSSLPFLAPLRDGTALVHGKRWGQSAREPHATTVGVAKRPHGLLERAHLLSAVHHAAALTTLAPGLFPRGKTGLANGHVLPIAQRYDRRLRDSSITEHAHHLSPIEHPSRQSTVSLRVERHLLIEHVIAHREQHARPVRSHDHASRARQVPSRVAAESRLRPPAPAGTSGRRSQSWSATTSTVC
jgi:hypothetical protein